MNMKNDLINHINTKVSAPNMEYSSLITSGANTLDEAFKPHKKTNEIVILDNHLQNIRNNQLEIMGNLAIQEQNNIAMEKMNEVFKQKEKENNELGISLFTNNGTNLDGNEETFKQNILKDVEAQTKRKDLTIDDLIRNVDNPQLALSQNLKDNIIKYGDYKYNKNKIDNRVLDQSDIDKLAIDNFDQYAIVGQNIQDFKNIFESNNNSFDNVIKDKDNKLKFIAKNSNRDLKAERIIENLINIRQGKVNQLINKNNQTNNQSNRVVNNESNQVNQIDNQNTQTNQNTQIEQNNDVHQISKKEIDYEVSLRKMTKDNTNKDSNIQMMYDNMSKDPSSQLSTIGRLLNIVGANKIVPMLDDKPETSFSYSVKNKNKQTLFGPYREESKNFFLSLIDYAEKGSIFDLDLDDFDPRFLTTEFKQVYNVVQKLQDKENTKYFTLFDEADKIKKDPLYMTKSLGNGNINSPETNAYMQKYYNDGKAILKVNEEFEKGIKENRIFEDDNRDLHNDKKDITLTPSNNMLVNLYPEDLNNILKNSIYYLSTSDPVIKIRNKYIKDNGDTLYSILKDPKLTKVKVKELKKALSDVIEDINYPVGVDAPNPEKLAYEILSVDAIYLKNRKYFEENPSGLYAMYKKIEDAFNNR